MKRKGPQVWRVKHELFYRLQLIMGQPADQLFAASRIGKLETKYPYSLCQQARTWTGLNCLLPDMFKTLRSNTSEVLLRKVAAFDFSNCPMTRCQVYMMNLCHCKRVVPCEPLSNHFTGCFSTILLSPHPSNMLHQAILPPKNGT